MLLPATLVALMSAAHADDDPHRWLEEVEGEAALDWVRAQNATSTARLEADPGFTALKDRLRAIYDADDRIPYVGERGGWLYNFWQDGTHPKGLWRRTTWESYRTDAPTWDVLLDLDALAEADGVSWVWRGADCLRPAYTKCLVELSRGGADATVTREYDLTTRTFVDGGFTLPEAKGGMSWIDDDTVFVATDFGEGSMTDSGYPRVVKRWRRGTPLAEAEVVFEGEQPDISSAAWHDHTPGFARDVIYRGTTFWTNEMWVERDGVRTRLDKPDDANAGLWRDWLVLELRSDWTVGGTTWPAGSLLAVDLDRWLAGKGKLTALFTPTERTSLVGWTGTRHHLLLTTLDNVKNAIVVATPKGRSWKFAPLEGAPTNGTVSVSAVDADAGDAYWLTVSDYVTPTTLLVGTVGKGPPEVLKQLPSYFDADGLVVTQHEATSLDGTRVPYFQVARADVPLDGSSRTLLYGYGGFEIPLLPSYAPQVGAGWLERGGVYVVANIRGGGEFGPRWHQAALKANRHKAYEDFEAVAEDLVRRGVTTTPRLGILGGSNGGLLMGNMLVRRPDLWGAIVCRVPLLDMRRYHELLAGASWMAEYGDPDDPAQWEFIQTFSPYHNVKEGVDYPSIFLTTSTRDDRVHPGHARKMFARLVDHGETDALYYENIEGGHGGAADNAQRAYVDALVYTYLWNTLE